MPGEASIWDEIPSKKEYSIEEPLPYSFTLSINDYLKTELKKRKSFSWIASDLGTSAAYLSRWTVGLGPLTEENIKSVAKVLGFGIYTTLWLPRPDFYGPPQEE